MSWVETTAVQEEMSSPEGLLKGLQELMIP